MYNENIKQLYIDSVTNEHTQKTLQNLFNRIEDGIESPNDKDIAIMGLPEVKRGFESMKYLSFSTLRTDIGFVKDYAIWYDKNIKSIDLALTDLTARDIDISEAVRTGLYRDEFELGASLKYWSANEGFFEAPIFCLTWLGMEIQEILDLKTEDVIFENGIAYIKTPKKTIQVKSDYIYGVLQSYNNVKRATRRHRGEWEVYADDIGYFIKNFILLNSKLEGRRITAEMVRKKVTICNTQLPNTLKKITLSNALLSGRLWRIREEERATGELTNEMFVKEFNNNSPKYVVDMLKTYEIYKKVFGE